MRCKKMQINMKQNSKKKNFLHKADRQNMPVCFITRRERLRQCNGDSDSTEVDGIYPEEESMQKSVQVNVQDNGNSGGVLWENINRHLQ